MLRGRFAPTPSGFMHIGNAWTALLAWLQIRGPGGRFVLRIEDIDGPRSKPEYARQIVEDLRWLGLDWDEGPDTGGPHGPYVQSERLQLYENVLQILKDKGRLYSCFCSRAELAAVASAPHGLASEGPVYPGLCRRLSWEEVERKARGKTPSLRFEAPDTPVAFEDAVYGTQQFPPGAGGDFIVRRADGIFAYQLAVVVDDAAMEMTDVLRGSDLLDSTPRQIMLYEALDYPIPRFAHVPLLYGPDGERLSKRHGAVALTAMRAAGMKPEAITGMLAFWAGLIDRAEPVTPHDLIGVFDWNRIPREPVLVTEKDLLFLSGRV